MPPPSGSAAAAAAIAGYEEQSCNEASPLFLGSLTYPTFLPSYGPYGPYGPSVTYSGLGSAIADLASRDPPRPSGRVP
ncbi:hypothetical protein L249_5135, partial [Ophiocordyceps polyrhachis-furcata BCC 54312]